MENAPLTIKYIPEAKDYVRASRALAKKSTSFIIMAVLLVLAMAAAAVILLVPSVGEESWDNIAMILLVVGAFYIVYFFVVIPWQLKRAYKKNEHLQVERQFILKDESIGVRVGSEGTELNLDYLEKVVEVDDLYLMIYKDKQKLYFFIPERAFTKEVSEKAFVDYLQDKSISMD
jgi:hypothetical protein